MRRHVVLPARGVLHVSTDVHGNLADFARLEAVFEAERAQDGPRRCGRRRPIPRGSA